MSTSTEFKNSDLFKPQADRSSLGSNQGIVNNSSCPYKMENICPDETSEKPELESEIHQSNKGLPSTETQKPSTSQDSANSSFESPLSEDQHFLKNGDDIRSNGGLLFSDLSRTHLVHDPYYYDAYDYDYELSHSGFDHSPMLGRGFGRHRGKIEGDPTILLTLVRWARIGSSQLRGDDDQIDRMNYQITSVLLLVLLMLTGFRQYLSHLPLQCWIPQEFSRSWEEYAEHYCWVTNTYFSNIQSALPKPDERTTIVRYYQWATFVLALQAAGFVLPCLLWRLFQNNSGFHVQRVMRSAIRLSCTPPESMALSVKNLAQYMDSIIYQKTYKTWRKKFEHSNKSDHKLGISSPNLSSQPTKANVQHGQKEKSKTSSPESSTNTSHHTSPKTVQFGDPLTSMKEIAISSDPNSSVSSRHTIPRSHKKVRAPLPPGCTSISSDQVHLCSPSTPMDKSTNSASLNVTGTPAKYHSSRSRSSTKNYRKACSLCFTKCCNPKQTNYTHGQFSNIKSPSVDRIRMKRDASPSSSRPVSSTNKCQNSLCCLCPKPSRPQFNPLQNVSRTRSQTQSKNSWKQICIQIGSGCWLILRFILTLTCLFPVCLCQWCRGNHKIKGLRKNNSFLFYLYVTIKLLYLINILGQLYFMKLFLGAESCLFGFYVLRDLALGNIWTQTGNFPRVTYCDFEAKKLGKNYRYTLQCVLPLNLFLEKVYIFLWFWMLLLCLLTLYSLFKWLTRLIIPQSRVNFITKFLCSWNSQDDLNGLNQKSLKMFVEKYLDLDGVFLLWLISINAGDLVIGELINVLWNLFSTRLSTQNPNYPVRDKGTHLKKLRSRRPVNYFHYYNPSQICPAHAGSCNTDSNYPLFFRSQFNPVYSPGLFSNHRLTSNLDPNNPLQPILPHHLADQSNLYSHTCKFISAPVNLQEHDPLHHHHHHHRHHHHLQHHHLHPHYHKPEQEQRQQHQQQSPDELAHLHLESCGSSDSIV